MITNICLSLVIYFFIFCAYLELSPSIGNVWFRRGSDGLRHINLPSLFHTILSPFKLIELWYPKNWDLNYFIGVFTTFGVIYIIRDYKTYKKLQKL